MRTYVLREPVSECREDPRVHSCGTISRIDHVKAESPCRTNSHFLVGKYFLVSSTWASRDWLCPVLHKLPIVLVGCHIAGATVL